MILIYKTVLWLFLIGSLESRMLRRVKRGWMSSGKLTGVKCAFNPCSVPGFCGTGRTCEMDENCRHSCECEVGSKHQLCAEQPAITTTPKAVKCTFNPCDSPAFACSQGRKCVLGEFCMPECECTDKSTHPECDDKHDISTRKPEETTTEIDKCKTGEIICVHGLCTRDKEIYTCHCDKGWEGKLCNESQCTKKCEDGSYCHFVTETLQICLEDHTSRTSTERVDSSSTPSERMRTKNVCKEDYIEHDILERKCQSGDVCQFGVCIVGEKEKCKCDFGASGKLCEHRCCRDCGEFGSCWLEGLEEECICNDNYTGVNCQVPFFDSLNGK